MGQALVEFAIVAPILILILASLVQLAFIYERQIGIENAVRDAARRASTLATTDDLEAAENGSDVWHILTDTGGLLQDNVQAYNGDPSTLKNPEVCYSNKTDSAGNSVVFVKVSMGYSHPLWLPLITQLLDGFDGVNDNAFRVDTSAEFQVQNTDPAGVTAGCYEPGGPT